MRLLFYIGAPSPLIDKFGLTQTGSTDPNDTITRKSLEQFIFDPVQALIQCGLFKGGA